MTTRIRDRALQHTAHTLVGRERELSTLLAAMDAGSSVVHVHGVAGIGKSSLLAGFAARAVDLGARVFSLDSRTLEPTARGLLTAMGRLLGGRVSSAHRVGELLASSGGTAVIVLDHYEHLRLLDTWVRQVLVPTLPTSVLLVTGSREPPVAAWLTAPELSGEVTLLPLGPLEPSAATLLLEQLGVSPGQAEELNRVTRGHPLAIRLAAKTAAERPELTMADVAANRVVEELSRLYLADVPDRVTRRVLEAASVVRRVTASLIGAMLADVQPSDALERLQALPFVEVRRDGLSLHEAVQGALADLLEATDPVRHREYRRKAWRELRHEVRDVGAEELWRYTADMLYLIENPVVREAFFPSGAQPLAVEPAAGGDLSSIELIAARHDGEASRAVMRAWWEAVPEAFSVARDRDGAVAGFSILLDHRAMSGRGVEDDPVVAGWRRHLRASPPPHGQQVLGFRRWLDAEHGELPCGSQAASWLDVKRTYMQLRPHLRRIYTVVERPGVYLPVVTRLGFRPVGPIDGVAEVGGRTFTSVVLDFGPASVDGWLAGLVAAELGLAPDVVIDSDAREVQLAGRRLQLTRLEFGVISCLQQHEGRAVSRASLLEQVWGYEGDIGSNVVDVVVRRLRQKLGDQGSVIETIRGSGYRLSIQ
ncbi:MAG: winged helix-turn-helix domain-containing protein [Candidatus Limnocylindria bacterium]